jgi:ubiquinone/menaquinone biosynthesis C-methylase UbiE
LSILEKEKIKAEDKKVVVDFAMKYFPDFRRILNELQRFALTYGEINVNLLSKQSESNLNISLLMKALKEKDYQKTREWVVSVLDNDPSRIFRKIYDSLGENLKPQSVPEVVVLMAHYQYQSAFSIDKEINLLAFLVELMVLEAIE